MKVSIGDKEFSIKETDMKLARAAVNEFIEVAKRGSEATCSTSLYLTTILMMYKKSATLINELGVENLERILTDINEGGGNGNG